MAATDLEKLVVQLSADIKKYENQMRRAQAVTNKELGAIQKKADNVSKGIGLSFARSGAAIVAGLATGTIAREMLALSEAATRIDNSLKVAGVSGAELEKVYASLSASAKANGAPIETLAALYGKAAQAQKELGVSSDELLGFTNNVALALRVAGTDAQTASGALLQLGQALGAGKVQAEEFNSILEGAPTIAQAVAAGLKEAGGSVSQLKKLIIDGKISSEAFFRAFEAGAPILQEKVANSTFTVAQATTNLTTALIDVTREFNAATGAGENLAGGINSFANAIDSLDVGGFIAKIREMRGELNTFLGELGNADVFQRLNELTGTTDANGNVFNPDVEAANNKIAGLERDIELLQQSIEQNTNLGFDNTEAIARIGQVRGELAALRAEAANLPATVSGMTIIPGKGVVPTGTQNVKINATAGAGSGVNGAGSGSSGAGAASTVNPVSISDFKPPVGSGSGGGKKGKQSEYAREIEQIKERTAALQAETAAQATVNPLLDDYGFAMERARAEQDLLNAAQQAGLTITPQLRASIAALAEGYAQASAAAEKLQESQAKAKAASEDFKNTAKDVTSGFIDDLRAGKSAAEALAGALDKVVDKLIDVALNAVFNIGGGGGFLGKLFGFKGGGLAKFAGGGTVRGPGGPRDDKVLARLSNGEFVVNAKATKQNRALLEAINSGLPAFANGGAVNAPRMPTISARQASAGAVVNYSPTIDARGADQAAVARLERTMADERKRLPQVIMSTVNTSQTRRIRPYS